MIFPFFFFEVLKNFTTEWDDTVRVESKSKFVNSNKQIMNEIEVSFSVSVTLLRAKVSWVEKHVRNEVSENIYVNRYLPPLNYLILILQ